MQELVCADDCDEEPQFSTLREYIYGPQYVDQFMLQINQPGATTPVVSYTLQDDNYNVVALTNASGVIIRQHALDPYGSLIARDDFPAFGQTSAPKTRLGHQGLFVERLDAPWDVDLTVVVPPGTEDVVYLNRNRVYQPTLGRFMQRDPNETALALAAVAMNGAGFAAPMQGLDMRSAYAGGMNLFGYHGANPINQLDPNGLFTYGDVMGTTAVRASLTALEVGATVALALDVFSAVAAAATWRNALLDAVIVVAADRLGGKLFDQALDVAKAGIRAINNAFWRGGVRELGEAAIEKGFGPHGFVGRGSTGRTAAMTLKEQLAMEAAKSNPGAGKELKDVVMNDPRWPHSEGWCKMSQNIEGVEIHYVWNEAMGLVDDFKFK